MTSKNISPSIKNAMSRLGSIGGKAIVRKRGKSYMKNLVDRYWKSPAGRARRAKSKGRILKTK